MKPRYYFALAAFGVALCVWGLALAQVPDRTAKLSWIAVTKAVDGSTISGVTYNIYQGAKGSTSKPKVKTGLTALTFTASGLPPGETCWNMTAQTAVNGESALSNEACKSFPYEKPETTTLTVE